MTGHLGLLFESPSQLPNAMKEAVEFQQPRLAKFNTKMATEIYSKMAYFKKKRAYNIEALKKIQKHIECEEKRIAYMKNKYKELQNQSYFQ